jgi:putative oxidoreductase
MSSSWSGSVSGNQAGVELLREGRVRTPWPAASDLEAFTSGRSRIETLERYGTLVARILLSQIFLISGVMKIVDWSGTEAHMAGRGMFWIPFFHVAALLTELVGGLSLLLGYRARLGAVLLFLFLIPVTLTFHNFWTYTDPREQQVNMLFFLHNLTLMGGLLLLLTIGPGPLSLDLRGRRSA